MVFPTLNTMYDSDPLISKNTAEAENVEND